MLTLTILASFPLLRSCWTAYACSTLSMETALTITTLSFSLEKPDTANRQTVESLWSRQCNLILKVSNMTGFSITQQNLTAVSLRRGLLSARLRWQWRSHHSENEGYPFRLKWLSRSQTLVPVDGEEQIRMCGRTKTLMFKKGYGHRRMEQNYHLLAQMQPNHCL